MRDEDIDHWRVNRRDFLALSALVAAMSLGGTGAENCYAGEIVFPEGNCGDKNDTEKKVLITYASKYGSTGGVAEAIGNELCSKGISTEVLLIKNVSNVSAYRVVVVGSAIYMGEWMDEAVDFLKKNKDVLRQIPVACFLVCMTLAKPTEKDRAEVLSYMDFIRNAVPEIRPIGIGAFAGALHYGNLSWIYKKILKSKGTPEGDFRDWNAIRTWAQDPVWAKISR